MPAFPLESNDLKLERRTQPFTPFDKAGRRFAILGFENGRFEAWGYPIKILRNFELSFMLGNSTEKIRGSETARWISVTPEATVITYTHQSFTVRAIHITPVKDPGTIILLDVDSIEPMTVVAGFLPVLQPMWPAGIGGQYSHWNDEMKAYIISESRRQNVGYVGSPAAAGISYTPAHMLSDFPQEFRIEVNPKEVVGKYIPIILSGGMGDPDEYKQVYQSLAADPEKYYRQNHAHFQALRENTIRIITPDKEINLAYEWAKVAYDNLVITNPRLGTGLVAGLGISGTSGRPGFGWYFGGDTFINSLSIVGYGDYPAVRDALRFTKKWQRDDGKMAHELSQSAFTYINWFEDYKYGYIHGDTTPWYLVAMGNYFRASGDVEFIRESWPSVMKAYRWCLSTDQNGDALMDNKAAGLGALEYGPLAGILTDVYLGAIWVQALDAMSRLAAAVGEDGLAAECRQRHEETVKTLNDRFWDRKNKHLSYAFNTKGKKVPEVTPWGGVGMIWDLFEAEKSSATLTKLCSAELTTDWGVRSISNRSKYYQPLNYNYGAVWPFLSSFISTSLYMNHFSEAGYAGLFSTVCHTFDNALGSVTEVFSGDYNVWPGESVHHQGFSSAGAVLPLVRGLLGLEVDAPARTITFVPHLPADWQHLEVGHIVVGSATVDLVLEIGEGAMELSIRVTGEEPVNVHFSPAFRTGKITEVLIDGKSISYETHETPQDFHIDVVAEVKRSALLKVKSIPSFDLVFPRVLSKTGDTNRGLKVVQCRRGNRSLEFDLDGLAGETYHIRVLRPEHVAAVSGGTWKRNDIEVSFAEGKPGKFVRQTLKITGR
ncbi:MAG: hypothetical protein KAU50_12870 [Candidatus Marinimicrobia bacterium]|nr:hypothetical protein [Candidatus Neomarinimicrobiota bacterium]